MSRRIALLMAILGSGQVLGADGDLLQPSVDLTLSRDDNLLRLDSGESTRIGNQVVTRESAGDLMLSRSAGLKLDWRPARQQVTAEAVINQVRYQKFSSLDYDGKDAKLNWVWRVGNHFSGNLGTSRQVSQTNTSEQKQLVCPLPFVCFLQTFSNEVTRDRRYLNGEWAFHPRWQVGAGVNRLESSNSEPVMQVLDNTDDSTSLTLRYLTPKGSRVTGQWVHRTVDYYRATSNNYVQDDLGLSGDWAATGKAAWSARIGHIARKYQSGASKDFSGVSARVRADFYPTAKQIWSVSVYRDLSGTELENSIFRLNTGVSLSWYWQYTAKLSLRASAQRETHDYKDDASVLLGAPQRKETDTAAGLSLGYRPMRPLTFNLGLQSGMREANVVNRGYRYTSLVTTVRADF